MANKFWISSVIFIRSRFDLIFAVVASVVVGSCFSMLALCVVPQFMHQGNQHIGPGLGQPLSQCMSVGLSVGISLRLLNGQCCRFYSFFITRYVEHRLQPQSLVIY